MSDPPTPAPPPKMANLSADQYSEVTGIYSKLRQDTFQFFDRGLADSTRPLEQTISPYFKDLQTSYKALERVDNNTKELSKPRKPYAMAIPDSTEALERACQEDLWTRSVAQNAHRTTRMYWQAMLHEFPDINRAASKRKGDCSAEDAQVSKHARVGARVQRATGCSLNLMPKFLTKFSTLELAPLETYSNGLIVTVPGIMVCIMVFEPSQSRSQPLQIRRVAVFGLDEVERTDTGVAKGIEWQTSAHRVFRTITHHATDALEFLVNSDVLCVLKNMCDWLASYTNLFSQPCAYCRRILMAPCEAVVRSELPPTVRTLDDYTAYHPYCFQAVRAAGLK